MYKSLSWLLSFSTAPGTPLGDAAFSSSWKFFAPVTFGPPSPSWIKVMPCSSDWISVTAENNHFLRCLFCSFFLPSASSPASKMTALHPVTAFVIEWIKGRFLRFELIRAACTPISASPSQIAAYSGRFVDTSATTSPFWHPNLWKYDATRLLYSRTWNLT